MCSSTIDNENDPNFIATAIVRTNSNCRDGKLILYEKKKRIFKQKNRSVFLMDASIEHEVSRVTSGTRNSFIVVLGNREKKSDKNHDSSV